jgi:excisionase family DNA binding protein
MTNPVYLTVKEYARYRRVSTRTVARWLSRKELPAERMGNRGHWRIRVWRDVSDAQPRHEADLAAHGLSA